MLSFSCLLQNSLEGDGKLHILFLFFVALMFCISLWSLFGYHLYLTGNNKTTLGEFEVLVHIFFFCQICAWLWSRYFFKKLNISNEMNILPKADDIQCREMTFTGKLQLNQLQKRGLKNSGLNRIQNWASHLLVRCLTRRPLFESHPFCNFFHCSSPVKIISLLVKHVN